MREPKNETRGLSQSAGELLDAWLQTRLLSSEFSHPDVDALVRYQSGALSPEAIRSVETSIIRHPSGRALLKSTRSELQRLRRLPWSEVGRIAHDDSLTGEVARSWMAVTAAAVGLAAAARESWETQGWSAIQVQVAAGVGSAKAAWAGFMTIGEQLRYVIRTAQPAVARSGSDDQAHLEGALPLGVVGALHAEIDAAGTLNVALSIQDSGGEANASLDGTLVHLTLMVNGQAWPLAPSLLKGDRAVWALLDAGHALGLAAGPLPASFFGIALGEADRSASGAGMRLMAVVLDAEGGAADRIPVPLEIHDGPKWEDGVFQAVVLIDGAIRRAYADYRLRLDVTVAGTARQCLGYWPLSDWSDLPRLLTAECPGSPDSDVPYTAVLHATLEP
jgi:hypothetical protein